jgi:hypothetical protein
MIIYKYPLRETYTEIELQIAAVILDVQIQDNEPVMWVMQYTTEMPTKIRRFRLLFTGHKYDEFMLSRLKHISTLQYHDGGLIVHVFEDTASNLDDVFPQ